MVVGQNHPGRPARFDQFVKPTGPIVGRGFCGEDEPREQQVVQFVGVAYRRPGLVDDLADCLGVETTEVAEFFDRQAAAGGHGPSPSFLDFSSVEERVGVGIEQFPGERRRFTGVAAHQFDFPGVDSLEHLLESGVIQRLVQTVVHRLLHQRVVGDLVISGDVLLATGELGKDGRQQVVGTESLDRVRHLLGALPAEHHQRSGEVPSPAELEDRDGQQCLFEQVASVVGSEHSEEALKRKTVLRAEREDEAVVIGGGLQFEIEGPAEPLSQRQSPGPVDPRAERGVDHHLHSARFVEEPFEEHSLSRGDQADGGLLRCDVIDNLSGGVFVAECLLSDPPFRLFQPSGTLGFLAPRSSDPFGNLFSQPRDLLGEFPGSPGGFASPEGNRRRGSAGVGDRHPFAPDMVDSPRGVSQQEDVARLALDREVLVERSHEQIVLGDDPVAADVGDRSGVGAGRKACRLAGSQPPADSIVVQVDASASGRVGDALGKKIDHPVEGLTCQLRIRPGAPGQRE